MMLLTTQRIIANGLAQLKALFIGLFDGTTDEVAFDRSGRFLSRIEPRHRARFLSCEW